MKIGLIGLGRMGVGMAANILAAGHELSVYNRTPGKADALTAKGARLAAGISDACSGEIVVSMLSDDRAVEAVVYGEGGVLESLHTGALHISSSTISVALAKRLAADHAAAGQRYLSAPVFGRPDAAAAGKLFVVAAGSAQDIETAAPVFEAVGQRTFNMGEQPDAANLAKLGGNFLIMSVIESLGEVLALVDKGGIDRADYLEMLTSTLFSAPIYTTYGSLIIEGKFQPPGFAASLGKKDIGLVLEAAETLQVALPVASLVRDRFLTLMAQGGDVLDWSAIGGLAARDAGIV
jgi:3-hydroxyisobutyrate dehydrogenase-like beta-hydroxyacid dehydrogenase